MLICSYVYRRSGLLQCTVCECPNQSSGIPERVFFVFWFAVAGTYCAMYVTVLLCTSSSVYTRGLDKHRYGRVCKQDAIDFGGVIAFCIIILAVQHHSFGLCHNPA